MWKHTVSVISLLIVTNCVNAINPEVANKIRCCECTSMIPSEMRDIEPQLVPSPFVIKIDPEKMSYSMGGTDINGKLVIPKVFQRSKIPLIRL
jgi:hypothetical protein